MYLNVHYHNIRKVSFIVLALWLCAILSHSTHALSLNIDVTTSPNLLIEHSETLYQQTSDVECHLCLNHIDTNNDDLSLSYPVIGTFVVKALFSPLSAQSKYFLLPNLRGPPSTRAFYS